MSIPLSHRNATHLAVAIALLALTGCARVKTAIHRPGPSRPGVTTVAEPGTTPAPDTGTERLWTNGTMDVPVIMYHDVVPGRHRQVWFDLTTAEFEEQMAALHAAGASVVPLADLAEHLKSGKPLPPKAIALTFDDGTLGDYTQAFPILKRYGYPATFFVHTGYVGRTSDKKHMTWDQLREVKQSGLIDVQPHTVNHPEDLTQLSDEEVQREINDSNATLEREMGYKPRFFAYPSGHGDERVAQFVAAGGYEAAFNEVRAWAASPADRLFLPRFAPFRLDDILERWRRETPPAPSWTGPITLNIHPDVGHGALKSEGVAFVYHRGGWPIAYPKQGGIGGLEPAAQPILSESSVPPDFIRCTLVIAGEGDGTGEVFAGTPDPQQWGDIDLPLIVSDGRSVAFAPYRPWMGISNDALQVLLPGTNFAVLGADWLLHAGQPTPSTDERSLFRPAFLAVDGEGVPIVAQAEGRATRAAVIGAAQQLHATEAVLLSATHGSRRRHRR